MLIIQDTPNEIQQTEEKVEAIKTHLQNKSIDDPHIQRLWIETFDYRQSFIKQNTTVNIMEQFSFYSNPSMVRKKLEFLVGQTVETGDSMEIIDTDSSKTIGITIFERTLEDMEDKIVKENTGTMMTIIEVGIDQEIEHSQGIMVIIGIEVQAIVGQDQDL